MSRATTPRDAPNEPAGPGREQEILALGRRILDQEAEAVACARSRLGPSFVAAVDMLLGCSGRVAVTGMGKAGLIGRKVQATLASTGTAAYALHPADAMHGDLGMMRSGDMVLALSNSGETQELVSLLPVFRGMGCPVILLTGRPQSRCARAADVVVDIGDTPEACPLGLAPSSSTSAMLAVGDALALTLMKLRNVQREEYAAVHPGGALGRSLMRVREIMRTGADCPQVRPEDTVGRYCEVLEQAPRRAGAAAVVDAEGRLAGIFTHGDFVRCFRRDARPLELRISAVMTANPKFARADDLVGEALRLMQNYRIDELPVVDENRMILGLIDIQDLVAYGFSLFDDQ